MTDLARAETLAARLYHDPAAFEQERQRLFARDWTLPGHESEISEPGETRACRVEPGPGCVVHHVPTRAGAENPVYCGFWAWVAPNLAFNVYGNGMSVERMLPTGPRTTRIEYLLFFDALGESGRARREDALSVCERVTGEDRVICEAVQRNLEAGVYRRGRLSPRHEAGVHAFQERVRAALSAAAGEAPGRASTA